MNTQNNSPVSMKSIFNSEIETFTMNAVATKTVDMHVVYISKILNEGSELWIKPLSTKNLECYKKEKGMSIINEHRVIGLEIKENIYYIRIAREFFKSKSFNLEKIHDCFDIKIETAQDVAIPLLKIQKVIFIEDTEYEKYKVIYAEFLKISMRLMQETKKIYSERVKLNDNNQRNEIIQQNKSKSCIIL